ncbi:hypothetical protein [Pseudomonas putida]|uniref:Lysozyme inhibitor LprI N-terminal domain-containing protein n=1 Tax=Pseudomonas putida TaxID=303 RepID=A0A6I6XWE0_PSEPU|nr:hypothetical protein [Pseudomonas putida]QHG64595.1 hypothetical protein C2H86_09285 [Pseudomonas putida]
MTAVKGYLICGIALTTALSNAVSAESLIDAFALTPGDKVIETSVNDCLGVYHTMNERMLDKLSGFDVGIGTGVRLYPKEHREAMDALKDFWDRNAHRYSPNDSALNSELQTLRDALNAANQRYLRTGADEWYMKSLSRSHSDFISERFRLREQLDDVTYAWAQCPAKPAEAAACRGEAIRQLEAYFQDAHKQLGQFLPRMINAYVPMENEWWVACRAPDFTGAR